MGRKYSTAGFYDSAAYLRELFPNAGITADVIAGFPGETDEEHHKSLDFINKCAFSAVHVFPFSRREGTLAARMPGQLKRDIKTKRAWEIRSCADKLRDAFLLTQIGKTLEVLFETGSSGHSGNYLDVTAEGAARGQIRGVLIESAKDRTLYGRIV